MTNNYALRFLRQKAGFILNKKSISLLLFFQLFWFGAFSQATVTGKVTTSNGDPLQGVSVLVAGTKNGTTTNNDGRFKLTIPDGENTMLEFSSVGFQTKTVNVGKQTEINITLEQNATGLSDVVVVGYGTQKKSSLTGAVGSISPKEIQKLTVENVGAALQGRTPGVTVNTDGGVAGSAVTILIRGAGSLSNITPLYVVDGAFVNSLSAVNVNDIESVEVLKDASAAAIYGSRAANGVVLISTKTGKTGAIQINLNSSYSLQTPSKYLSFLNATQNAKLLNEVAVNDGITPPTRIGSGFNPAIDVDYQRLWFGNAPMYNIGVDLSGGQKNSTFFTSFNYFDQKSILAFSGFKRYDFRLNNTLKKNRFKLEEYLSVNRTENKPNYTYSGAARGFDVPYYPVRNPDPTLWGINSDGYTAGLSSQYYLTNSPSTANPTYTVNNIFATGALSNFKENASTFTGGVKASYALTNWLTYSFGLNGYYQVTNTIYNVSSFSLLDIDGKNPSVQNRSFTEADGQYFQYSMDNLLSFKKSFGSHDIDLLVGQSWSSESSRTITNIAGPGNFVSNAIALPNGAIATSGNQYGSGLLSFFGRLNYDYDNRYLISASIRSDASSKFAEGSRVGVFPSVSAGWNIHNESFFKSNFISEAKIRASYGELGANFIPPYSFVSTIRATVPVTLGDQSRAFGTITQLANPALKWETSQTANFGVDLGFLKNQFTFTADYFTKNDINLLASLSPPPSSGTGLDIASSNYFANTANVRNNGVELSVGYAHTKGKFQYNLSANASHIKNTVVALGANVQPIIGFQYSGSFSDGPTITKPGLPIGTFWGYKTNGLYQKDSEVPQNGIEKGKRAGDLKFVDTNGDGIIDVKDKTNLGSPFPRFEYGINFSGTYSSFDFTIYFLGSQGNKIFNASKISNYFLTNKAKTINVLDAWTPSHTNTSFPRITTANQFGLDALPNSFYVENGSYFRLKNIQLGYTITKSSFKKIPFEKIRAFIGIQNLFTISKYSGYDPEVAMIPYETLNAAATRGISSQAYPLINRGVDSRAYPRDRTYIIGLKASF
ncbi:MAG: TonB-dependent receptor [Ginsengibacter sp.]